MSSLKAVLRDEANYDFPLSDIVKKYLQWVTEDKYMIFEKVFFKTFKGRDCRDNTTFTYKLPIKRETFAMKCSKRGNDVYRFRVYRRFKGLAGLSKKRVFFQSKRQRNQKD
jgi:hypothetical protein